MSDKTFTKPPTSQAPTPDDLAQTVLRRENTWGKGFEDKIWREMEAMAKLEPDREFEPPLRDLLKQEHNHLRPRDVALEKWGPYLEQIMERDMARSRAAESKDERFRDDSPSTDIPKRPAPDVERD